MMTPSFKFYLRLIALVLILGIQPGKSQPPHQKLSEQLESAKKTITYLKGENQSLIDTLKKKDSLLLKQQEDIQAYLKEIEDEKGTIEAKSEEIHNRNTYLIAFVIAAVLALGGVVVLFISLRDRKLVHKKLERNTSIVQRQAQEVQRKNKEITDSIKYARRIQEAMLPTASIMIRKLPKSFVLYLPKDIISGDFYWVTEKKGKVYVATADCTGHGVPGALMSMLGISFLNEIVNEREVLNPAAILNELKSSIINSLTKSDRSEGMQDGMDISLYCLDKKRMRLTYASANNCIYVMRDKEITVLNPDKQPVGSSPKEHIPFTESSFEIQENDMIISFTDGFADQFGGPKGKKFKYTQLQKLMLEVRQRQMSAIPELMKGVFNKWKGNHEQVDDVLVIGVRV